ncbi:hypothetical protein B0T17DRAFT_601662 [Bombardia bombarda]|uniref:Phytanoyl-CoA dioxygenase n=1 Tax=Bombardia bombarda TaxID=252184 RepID=A0AA39WHZ6_9PEZI|nr:hypothetical protein B0T17DRAFT_601662 [Bombardia bombarda]
MGSLSPTPDQPSSPPSASPSPLFTQLQTNGFVIVRSILTPAELSALRASASRITALARAGQWPHIRTVGKQFPPWPSAPDPGPESGGIWGVQHLLHPRLPVPQADRDVFARLYFSPKILAIVRELLLCSPSPSDDNHNEGEEEDEDDGLVMELCNMLVRPDADFALRWHRDDIPWTATPEEEEAALHVSSSLKLKLTHTQWNLALHPDDSLVLIPGSHRRARTPAERAAAPYETGLPGETRVALQPGDIAFYDNNILHRGVYDCTRERLTPHGSVGHVRAGEGGRARNVLQHGVGAWVGECDFGGLDGLEGEKGEGEGEVGYSLDG